MIGGRASTEISGALQFPATRRECLDKLQLKIVISTDRIEASAPFPFLSKERGIKGVRLLSKF
jgi:hypothetical protein